MARLAIHDLHLPRALPIKKNLSLTTTKITDDDPALSLSNFLLLLALSISKP